MPRWLRLAARGPRIASQLIRWGRPPAGLLFGPLSLGDDLLCTAVLREARKRNAPIAMFSNRPELFAGNPDPTRIIPIDDYYIAAIRRLGARVVQPYYLAQDPADPDRDILPPRHIIAEMCRLAGLRGTVDLRPWLFLTADERARGALFPRQIAMQSSGLGAAIPYHNKEWGPERFASAARLLGPDFKIVQLGSTGDPKLPADADLRGKTTLREAAAILASSAAFVGLEGFLTHLARAVDCPAVVVFGGRARPETFGYPSNINLFEPVDCAPCGLRNTCSFERFCLSRITPEAVANAARALAGRPREHLSVAQAELT
jgi:hypothetical protein